jgi:hypothetical protein
MLESKWGRLISYGERICKSYNYPRTIVFHINQNGPPLEVVFCKTSGQVISADYINKHLYKEKDDSSSERGKIQQVEGEPSHLF